ncbi:DUF952 domain-containing protein [Acholeplasma hippikon]|uniref:Uncharacterized protein conserved in bacteria n=1 Tax=Acholeplasma hippikon TaxID=264636 RepID=A0A449BL29_9MOLU|nr:DUF952 domain-containing protein [Acholeplasma hippikon]VEU83134.1 Uncharacterized protein conserved in bacteria [Acholeplasma hippikon]
MIIKCIEKTYWESVRNLKHWGEAELIKDGFIHNSTIETLPIILNKFSMDKSFVLLLLDENKLTSPLIYEMSKKLNLEFPHIYGPINNDAILEVLPLLRDASGNFIENPEFLKYK